MRHFERQFQVDGDVARNRSMDRWIGECCSYNFAAESFHTKKLCSRLFSREVEFYWHKQRYRSGGGGVWLTRHAGTSEAGQTNGRADGQADGPNRANRAFWLLYISNNSLVNLFG